MSCIKEIPRMMMMMMMMIVVIIIIIIIIITHCERVKQICVFKTVKLGTSASSP